MPWIESHQELRNHPKTKRLAKEMRISVPTAIGHLHCLWWWATDYAPDGDLTEYEDWEIADAAAYEGKNPDKFKNALISAGFLDNIDGRLTLHDWNDYGGKNLKRQKAANERNRRYRERQRTARQEQDGHETQEGRESPDEMGVSETHKDTPGTETSASRDGHETVTRQSQDADTRHDMTGHDKTRHEKTRHEKTRKEMTDTPLNPPEGEGWPPTLQEKRFAEFWIAYPKKQGKGAAEKAWKKIQPDAELHARIMDSVKAHALYNPQWLKDNGQYIPNPATWLNQKRWEDEKPKATQQTNGGGQGDAGQDGASPGFQRSTGFRSADRDPDPDS